MTTDVNKIKRSAERDPTFIFYALSKYLHLKKECLNPRKKIVSFRNKRSFTETRLPTYVNICGNESRHYCIHSFL